jgi:hypothetical protein
MGHKEVKVNQWVCDGCGKTFHGEPGLNFLGIQGNVNEHGPTGGWGGEWFACKRACIRKAIITVLDKVDWE